MAAVDKNPDTRTVGATLRGTGATSMLHPADHAFAITPDDSNDIAVITRGLYVGGAGNVKVTTKGGETLTLTALAAGVIHPIRVSRVFSTNTTATSIVGFY